MTTESFGVFVAIVTVLVITPGPALFLLIGTVSGGSTRIGLVMTLGMGAAIVSHATLAILGVGALILASATLFTMVKTAGAAYLIWLGVKSLRSTYLPSSHDMKISVERRAGVPSNGFLAGYLTNLLNPAPALFYVAAFPQFLDFKHDDVVYVGLMLGVTHATIAILVYGSAVIGMGQLSQILRRPWFTRTLRAISGVALVGLGARMLTLRSTS